MGLNRPLMCMLLLTNLLLRLHPYSSGISSASGSALRAICWYLYNAASNWNVMWY